MVVAPCCAELGLREGKAGTSIIDIVYITGRKGRILTNEKSDTDNIYMQ